MTLLNHPLEWILGTILILSSLGVILAKKPVHASLSFLLTLLTLATIFLQLYAQFISVMQILVYAGAILVLFMFVIILFQDAHEQIEKLKAKSAYFLLTAAITGFFATFIFLGIRFLSFPTSNASLPEAYGTVQSLGKTLYIDFFFPFEAITLLFLVAAVGALYIGKRVR